MIKLDPSILNVNLFNNQSTLKPINVFIIALNIVFLRWFLYIFNVHIWSEKGHKFTSMIYQMKVTTYLIERGKVNCFGK